MNTCTENILNKYSGRPLCRLDYSELTLEKSKEHIMTVHEGQIPYRDGWRPRRVKV